MSKIVTKNIKIPKIQVFDNTYIEDYLKRLGYDVIRWAITGMGAYEIFVSASCFDEA